MRIPGQAEYQTQTADRHRKLVYRIKTYSRMKYHLVRALLNMQGSLYRLPGWIAEGVEAVRPGAQLRPAQPREKAARSSFGERANSLS